MRRRVVITGAGVVCALGDDLAAVHCALCSGESGLGPPELFTLTAAGPEGAARPVGEVRGFAPATYLGGGNVRPLDRTSRLVASAAQLALQASGWTAPARNGHELGLVLGTMFGSVRTIAEFDRRAITAGPIYASPLDFANSVINAAAGQAAIWHRLSGINATIAGGPVAGLQALAYAADQVRGGRAPVLLAGGADELCLESYVGFERLGLLAGDGGPRPFDARRDGCALGEAAALLVLEDADAAAARGARAYAEVAGCGAAFDPSAGRDDALGAAAVARAIRQALAEAGIEPAAVEAVASGASGRVAGDRQEAMGIAAALGERAARVPVAAIKASLGETLGAAGALQVLTLLGAMASGKLPGVLGFERGEAGFALDVEPGERAVRPRCALATALGLDGQAAAVVVTAPEAG
jgi:3-oxoacyl-(acyl-carrier-protein) synthase